MTESFTVYFASAEDSLLWHWASARLGRDASSGEVLPHLVPEGFAAPRFADLGESARCVPVVRTIWRQCKRIM